MLSKYLADSPCPTHPWGHPTVEQQHHSAVHCTWQCGSAGQTVLAFPLAFQPFCIDDAALLCANSTLTVAASAQPSSPLIPPLFVYPLPYNPSLCQLCCFVCQSLVILFLFRQRSFCGPQNYVYTPQSPSFWHFLQWQLKNRNLCRRRNA